MLWLLLCRWWTHNFLLLHWRLHLWSRFLLFHIKFSTFLLLLLWFNLRFNLRLRLLFLWRFWLLLIFGVCLFLLNWRCWCFGFFLWLLFNLSTSQNLLDERLRVLTAAGKLVHLLQKNVCEFRLKTSDDFSWFSQDLLLGHEFDKVDHFL